MIVEEITQALTGERDRLRAELARIESALAALVVAEAPEPAVPAKRNGRPKAQPTGGRQPSWDVTLGQKLWGNGAEVEAIVKAAKAPSPAAVYERARRCKWGKRGAARRGGKCAGCGSTATNDEGACASCGMPR